MCSDLTLPLHRVGEEDTVSVTDGAAGSGGSSHLELRQALRCWWSPSAEELVADFGSYGKASQGQGHSGTDK